MCLLCISIMCVVFCIVLKSCFVWLFLVVFFFKQKTAYEMRISDWSSDVCSSDLAGFDLDLLGDLDELQAEGGGEDLAERGLAGAAQADQGDKIGRASCRERVCQYV